jgi:hypothetical protein
MRDFTRYLALTALLRDVSHLETLAMRSPTLTGAAGPREADLRNGQELHHEINELVSETGVGLTTGAPYTLSATFHEKFNSPTAIALNATFSIRQAIRVTSTTAGLNYTVLTTIYFVGLPTGGYKFTKLVDNDYVCQG